MSRYLDALKSGAVNDLWVFNSSSSTITNSGTGSESLTEDGNIGFKTVSGIMPGMLTSTKTQVFYDKTQVTNLFDNSIYKNIGFTEWEDYYSTESSFALELVFQTDSFQDVSSAAGGILFNLGDGAVSGLCFKVSRDDLEDTWSFDFEVGTDVDTYTPATYTLKDSTRYLATMTKYGRQMNFFIDGDKIGTFEIPINEELSGTYDDIYVGGFDRSMHSGAVLGSLAMFKEYQNEEYISSRYALLALEASPINYLTALSPKKAFFSNSIGYSRVEPQLDNPAKGITNELYYSYTDQVVRFDPAQLAAAAEGSKSLIVKYDGSYTPGPVNQSTSYTTDANSTIQLEYRIDNGVWVAIDVDTDTEDIVPLVNMAIAASTEGTL